MCQQPLLFFLPQSSIPPIGGEDVPTVAVPQLARAVHCPGISLMGKQEAGRTYGVRAKLGVGGGTVAHLPWLGHGHSKDTPVSYLELRQLSLRCSCSPMSLWEAAAVGVW